MDKKRSVGVAVFGCLLIFFPFSQEVIVSVNFLVNSYSLKLFIPHHIKTWISYPLFPVSQIVYIVTGIGILRVKEWARLLAVILGFGGIFTNLIFLTQPPISLFVKLYIIIIHILLVYFFTRSKVKVQFKQP
ncbi:MAG: hypothetical protein NTZ63_07120 [Candidatus Omnitrophica bacterium]|nr:hypothetical protein [Candidatus Omnitrophota bacterium]